VISNLVLTLQLREVLFLLQELGEHIELLFCPGQSDAENILLCNFGFDFLKHTSNNDIFLVFQKYSNAIQAKLNLLNDTC
jgi:hypothetical protein